MRKVSLVLILLLIFPIISASGLSITNNNYNVNKTYDQDEIISITIHNDESFPFYNLSFEDDTIFAEKGIFYGELAGEDSITKNFTIIGNDDFNGIIKIIGERYRPAGTENINHDVDVYFDDPELDELVPCSFSIIQGDNITWHNNPNDNFIFYRDDTGDEMFRFEEGKSVYTQKYNDVDSFSYHWAIGGINSDSCQINILSDDEYVHNPDYDANITLNMNVEYPPTELDTIFYSDTNYNLDVYAKDEGSFQIKNIGNNTAHNINLDCDWVTFNENNFDLGIGETNVISYTVSPNVLTTNETDKDYNKTLSITGNFQTITKTFNIYVNYADIDNEYVGQGSLIDMITSYCNENPNATFCKQEPQIIYRNRNATANLSNEEMKKIMKFWYTQFSEVQDSNDWMKEEILNMSQNYKIIQQNSLNTSSMLYNLIHEKNDNFSFLYGIIFIIITLVVGGLLYTLIIYYKKHNSFKGYMGKIRGVKNG